MNRSDICPVCKRQLRWNPPDNYGFSPGDYYCPKCKYHRNEGDARNIWKPQRKKGKRS